MEEVPRISIVTACLNMRPYIEQTISSVVQQRYPNMQYIVIDGESTDGTKELIDGYARQIDVFISKADQGQYDAIQKGLRLADGEIMGWLNADDVYFPWTLSVVGEIFKTFPDVDWITGLPCHLNKRGQCIRISDHASAYPRDYIRNGWFRGSLAGYLQQESMFWRRSLWERTGGLNLSLSHAADFDLWMRFAEYAELVSVSIPLAAFRHRPCEQRGREPRYEAEVLWAVSQRSKPPGIWTWVASRSSRMNYLCRLAVWKKSKLIAYSQGGDKWVLRRMWRPISRVSLGRLILESRVG